MKTNLTTNKRRILAEAIKLLSQRALAADEKAAATALISVADALKHNRPPRDKRHRSRQDHPTPWEFISAVEQRFGRIEIDLAATKTNAKAGRFITRRENSLKQNWDALLRGELGFLNPPFDPVMPWVDKAIAEAVKGARFVMLTQASVDSSWFWKMFPFCTSYALRRRMIFIGSKYVFPKPLILSAFNCVRLGAEPGPCGRLHEWDWMKDIGDGRYTKGE
jgi:phage N-6-adenine-methyltransferase